ncbi:MAG: hypothetical protein E3K32_08045 [wastewater metagenome]|nr:hypothetical protein [Candidatus Loosdrechtia aerotolerans]
MKTDGSLERNMYSELVTVYQCLEKELLSHNPGCNRCGTCCNFRAFDHVLYTSNIEVQFIKQHIKVPDFIISHNVCPFLKDNQCSIRDYRTLGCRTFYCNPHYKEVSSDIYEKYYRMIKELSIKYGMPWRYHPFLEQLLDSEHILIGLPVTDPSRPGIFNTRC